MSPSIFTTALENVSPHDVVIGRGRRIKEHPGNVRFMQLVEDNLSDYANALTKTKKSLIILKIMNEIRSHHDANFVKLDQATNSYYAVEEQAARITIAQALRDNLNQYYKSSKQHKQRKRLQIKRATATAHYQAQQQQQQQQGFLLPPAATTSLNAALFQDFQPLLARQVSAGSGSSTPVMSLKDILDEAVGLAEASTTTKPAVVEEEQTVMDDVFSSLFKAFAPQAPAESVVSVSMSADPFEPTPLAPPVTTTEQPQEDNASYGSLEDDWEPFPLSTLL